ncbi:bifunctional 3-(3-hydroxy-phenyl)propionate/3-hydroxycinnamic acid hydroxylase [Streptodolium elevatio]|uniref:Bifunctional 3-(3-hydroxy-phenyl)propionate/3-hydroxycinnamic acid hydroxylase n=1 Tax=Streptodolium elevatio TaxID=3157996 RepID=A0ABV3D975_9ACTN
MTVADGLDCDVAVVGYGPVGQALAIRLAGLGHRVTVVERRTTPYLLPRAVHFDDEIARFLGEMELGPRLADVSEPAVDYDWRNAAGETLLHFDWSGFGPSGWPTANMFSQPALEAVLTAKAESLPGVTVLRGHQAVALTDRGDHAELRVRAAGADGDRDGSDELTLRASYVVGCDGANSFVRDVLGTTVTDLGFHYDWLIVDVIPHEERVWRPFNLQVCDPARPSTAVSGGPGRRRWEFMRLPGETIADLDDAGTAWRLLADWGITADNATLERHTVYTFEARWADTWRSGRLLIAGDAAHLMPPFAGQGMCSGMRDVANLAWKLDLVLSGRSGDALLDTYGSERSAHVRNAIGISVELGNVICLTDPEAAKGRDEYLLGAGGDPETALPPVPPAVLGPGVVRADAHGAPVGSAGQPTPQGRVADAAGRTGLFDQIAGPGFVIATTVDPRDALTAEARALVQLIGARVVHIVPEGSPLTAAEPVSANDSTDLEILRVADVEGFYLPHMRAVGHEVAIVRPDHYLFGAAASSADLPGLLADLAARLHLHPLGDAA